MRSPHFFEPAQPPPLRKRHAIVSKKWPRSIWRYAKRWSQRFSAGVQRERRARIANPAPGLDDCAARKAPVDALNVETADSVLARAASGFAPKTGSVERPASPSSRR